MPRWHSAWRSFAAAFVVVANVVAAQAHPADTTASPSPNMIREVTVIAGDAHLTVGRRVGKPVSVSVETNAGTFELSGDSASIAAWADSASALPDPPPFAPKESPQLRSWKIQAPEDTNKLMRLARVPTSYGQDLELFVTNGAWGTYELLGDQASNILAVLRGSRVDSTDTAHVVVVSRPTNERACSLTNPLLRGFAPLGSPCRIQIERQAATLPHNPHPMYPAELQRARISGGVVLQFVVDTSGAVRPRSIRLVRTTQPAFALAVLNALRSSQYRPAEVDGHNVPQLVEQQFDFATQ